MPAGELRESVRFERRRQMADDGYGNVQYGWTIIAGPMPARIQPAVGGEQVLADRLTGVVPYTITVRWSRNVVVIDSGDRAINHHTGEIYNIASIVNEDERRQYLSIAATSGDAVG